MVTQYLPLYSKLNGNGFSYGTTHDAIAHAFTVSRGRPEVPLLSFGVAVLLLRRRPPEQVARLVAITLLLVWGFFYAVLGIKTWDYHYWPFIGASVAVVAVAFGDLQAASMEVVEVASCRVGLVDLFDRFPVRVRSAGRVHRAGSA